MQSKRPTTTLYPLVYFYLKLQKCFSRYRFWYSPLLVILFFISAFFQNDLLHAEDLPEVLGPSKVLSFPSTQKLQKWGFNQPEFRSLVEREYRLRIKIRDLQKIVLKDLVKQPYGTDIELWNRSANNIETELWMRRCQNITPEKFRQMGKHTRIIQAVKNETSRNFGELLKELEKEVGVTQKQKAPTKRVKPQESQPGNKTRIRDRVNKRGNIPPEEQPGINQKKTGQVAESEGGSQHTDKNNLTKKIDSSDKENIPNTNTASVGQKVRDEINRHGSEIIFLTVNIEMILKCKNSGTSARDCLAQLMVSNGIATSVSMAMQLLSEGAIVNVVMAGSFAAGVKLGWDTGDLLYNMQDWASAEWERYQTEKNRDKWTQTNLDSGSLDPLLEALQSKISATLAPISDEITSSCNKLRKQAITDGTESEIESFYDFFSSEYKHLPSPDTVTELKGLEEKAYDVLLEQRRLSKLPLKASSLLVQLKSSLKQARETAEMCASKKDAKTILLKYNSAKTILSQIEQIAGEARPIHTKVLSVAKEVQQAKTTLKQAFAAKNRISDENAEFPSYEKIEFNINKVKTAAQKLENKSRQLLKEVQALQMAFPDDHDTEYRFHELNQLIRKFETTNICDTGSFQKNYNLYAGYALEVKLDFENYLRPLEALYLDLSRFKIGQAEKDWNGIVNIQKEAARLIQDHQNLTQKAEECREKFPSEEDEVPTDEENTGLSDSDGDEFEDESDEKDTEDDSVNDDSDSGFSDESDDEVENPQTAEDDNPVDDAGFSDESDDPSPGISSESVTYFDRDFMPQSWRTSGNSSQTRVHIFSLGSRLGWAASLARYGGSSGIELIVDHLNGASGHVKGAHDNSFSPMKAYKDWQQIQRKHQHWIGQLQRKPNMQGRERQLKTLSSSLKGHAMGLAKKIAFQAWGNGLEQQENCDSYYLRIGYYLAYASQTLTFAAQAESQGISLRLLRKIISDGQSAAGTAARYMRDLKKLKIATGSCIDLSEIADQVFQGTRRGESLQALANAAHKGWQDSLNALGGGSSGSPDLKKIGEYLFADMSKFLPKGLELVTQKLNAPNPTINRLKPIYIFNYKKAFKFGSITSHNPGFYIELSHQMPSSRKKSICNLCDPSKSGIPVLKRAQLNRHGGKTSYCMRSQSDDLMNYKNGYSVEILWEFKEWTLRMSGSDHPNHPRTMFGPGENILKYAFTLLDHLVPRLNKAIEMYRNSGNGNTGSEASIQNRSPENSNSNGTGINLLGVEAN